MLLKEAVDEEVTSTCPAQEGPPGGVVQEAHGLQGKAARAPQDQAQGGVRESGIAPEREAPDEGVQQPTGERPQDEGG